MISTVDPVITLLTICGLLKLCFSEPSTPKPELSIEEMIRSTCLEKTGYRPLDSNDTLFRMVEVAEASNVSLPCSYCGESTADEPRIWRWRPRTENSTEREVQLGLAADMEANRLLTYPNHTLVIHNATLNDTGLYVCGGLGEEGTLEFQFNLDIIQPNISVLDVKKNPWEKYEEKVILKVNENIYESREPEVDELLDGVKIRVVSEWDPWMPCDGCSSVRRRYARCRVRAHLNLVKYPGLTVEGLNGTQQLLLQASVISCHSLDLSLWFPTIFSMTSTVPNLQEEQTCFDSCLRENRLVHEARYQSDLSMDIGSSMAFLCPDTDLRSKVTWKKDGVTMQPVGFRAAKKSSKLSYYKRFFKWPVVRIERAFVDRMNVLQLCLVGPDESAVYTCYLDNLPVKALHVTVVTAEETRRQRRYHFWLLSCYTSLLSATVVGVGLIWAFFRRHEFVRIVEE